MGSPEGEGDDHERPQHVLYLPTFYIGKTPVTVGTYRDYQEKSGRPFGEGRGSGLLNQHADNPVVAVTWHDALAFAEWHGFNLPSEAEWEKAARGTDGRRYPWGDQWREGLANTRGYWEDRGEGLRLPWGKSKIEMTTTPIGKFSPRGDSPYGCVDMAGNVWEWTRSLWGEKGSERSFSYPYVSGDGREDLEAPSQVLRVLRGGAFDDVSGYVRCAYRYRGYPDYWFDNIGFRVVLSPFPL